MHTLRILLLLLGLSTGTAFAQSMSPEKLGLTSHSIESKQWGTIHYYVSQSDNDAKKPLLLYLDGSGPYPLFQYMRQGVGSSVPFDYRTLAQSFHVVFISKPGVPFVDSVHMDPDAGYPVYEAPEEYTRRLSLDWRVYTADLVLKECLKTLPVDESKIAVLGISEGFQVGAKLLEVNKSVNCAALLVGNGLNQFYDMIIQQYSDAAAGKISSEEAQMNIDSLYTDFADIYADPYSTSKFWYGHTYLRWASFCTSAPVESLMKTTVPVLVISCSMDQNTSPLSSDYIRLEALRYQKKNIEFKRYPYDHSFNSLNIDGMGNGIGIKNHMQEVMQDVLGWISSH